MKSKKKSNSTQHRIALVLQGGGALGAYQAGVFEALDENNLTPDWVVGTSIGAINAALIAGNKPAMRLSQLKKFWARIAHPDMLDMHRAPDQLRQFNAWLCALDTVMRGVPGFFVPRGPGPFAAGLPVPPDSTSFYDTTPLVNTLKELVDFRYLNRRNGIRLTVNAMKLSSGELVSFDNVRHTVQAEHIMASGALPPGLPPVRVDGELHWDGGLYSNTPLETVLEDGPRVDTLCFMVDLWSAAGPEPTTLGEVQTRQKDIMYASRSERHIENYLRTRKLRSMVGELYNSLPPDLKSKAGKHVLAELGLENTIHIVRLPYAGRDWNMASKDINFSNGSIEWRWQKGYDDARQAIRQSDWLARVSDHRGLVVHELDPSMPGRLVEK